MQKRKAILDAFNNAYQKLEHSVIEILKKQEQDRSEIEKRRLIDLQALQRAKILLLGDIKPLPYDLRHDTFVDRYYQGGESHRKQEGIPVSGLITFLQEEIAQSTDRLGKIQYLFDLQELEEGSVFDEEQKRILKLPKEDEEEIKPEQEGYIFMPCAFVEGDTLKKIAEKDIQDAVKGQSVSDEDIYKMTVIYMYALAAHSGIKDMEKIEIGQKFSHFDKKLLQEMAQSNYQELYTTLEGSDNAKEDALQFFVDNWHIPFTRTFA